MMTKRDDDTRPLSKNELIGKLPVYQLECELKREGVIDAVNNITEAVDNNAVWLGRLIGIIVILMILVGASVGVIVFGYLKLNMFEQRLQAIDQKHMSETAVPMP